MFQKALKRFTSNLQKNKWIEILPSLASEYLPALTCALCLRTTELWAEGLSTWGPGTREQTRAAAGPTGRVLGGPEARENACLGKLAAAGQLFLPATPGQAPSVLVLLLKGAYNWGSSLCPFEMCLHRLQPRTGVIPLKWSHQEAPQSPGLWVPVSPAPSPSL